MIWHAGLWPRAYSGLLLKVPARRMTLVALANADALGAPQLGTSNVLLYPIANAFLRHLVLGRQAPHLAVTPAFTGAHDAFAAPATRLRTEQERALFGTDLLGRALLARWRREPAREEGLTRLALACCAAAVQTLTDADRLALLGESAEPEARRLALEAGQRLLAAFPDDAGTLFNLGLSRGLVLREYRIQGPGTEEAVAVFQQILALRAPIPDWMEAWSSYLVAEAIAPRDRARAEQLASRALATGVDTDGLKARATRLLERLGGRGGPP